MSYSSFVKVDSLKDTEAFRPVKVGNNTLSNKIVFAPTSRIRSLEDHTPSDLNLKHYSDRSKYPGSLVITEATFVSDQGSGYRKVPGIFTDKHVKAWKKITDQVHKNGSFIAVQGWFLGRTAQPAVLKEKGLDFVAPSPIYENEEAKKAAIEAGNPLRALTEQEIHDLIYVTYTNAAKKAIEAGFDYFELHGAHGYLLDTFLQASTNKRTDKYGGSIENRARIVLEIIDHLTEVIGAEKLAIRISPWATFQGILGAKEEVHPVTTFSYLVSELQKRADIGKRLAYISLVEPRVSGGSDVAREDQAGTNKFIGEIWKGPIVKAGNYTYDAPKFSTLLEDVEDKRTLVGFSRYYISNPDLVQRLRDGTDLTPYDRDSFYSNNNYGYNTYVVHGEDVQFDKETELKRTAQEIAV